MEGMGMQGNKNADDMTSREGDDWSMGEKSDPAKMNEGPNQTGGNLGKFVGSEVDDEKRAS
jgi:hypothetical protein